MRDICRQREADERKAAEVLRQAQLNRAATIKAADLDEKIEAAQREVDDVERQKNATKDTDPQSASMAKAIGTDQNLIAALSHAIFAIAIELGSGIGFWLVFGHGGPRPARAPASTALLPIDRGGAIELQVIDETPEEIIERFFLEVARPRLNGRVQSVAVWSAYKQWCAHRGYDAVSHAMFGRLARWRKDRIGGTVWYLDCELAEGYEDLALPGAVAKGRRRTEGPTGGVTAQARSETVEAGESNSSTERPLGTERAARWRQPSGPLRPHCNLERELVGS